MTILTTILNQKQHIIYGVIILVIASTAYHFFKKDPEVITKTLTKVETKIQNVEKVITKDKIVYVDRTITTRKKNGDVIVQVEHEHDITKVAAKTDAQTRIDTKITEKTVESFMKNYSIEVLFPVLNQSFNINNNTLDTQVLLGVRVFSLPIFVETGSNIRLNQLTVGVRVEF